MLHFSFFGVFSITLVLSFVFSTYSLGLDNSAHAVNRINTIDFEEESTNTRLRYYQYGIEQIIKNPIFGVGLGNWKIESIERDKENKSGIFKRHSFGCNNSFGDPTGNRTPITRMKTWRPDH